MSSATLAVSVPASHPALPGHFPGAPIVPAAWQLVLVEQACRALLGSEWTIVGLASARFRAPWRPGVGVTIAVRQSAPGRVQFAVDASAGRIADGVFEVRRR